MIKRRTRNSTLHRHIMLTVSTGLASSRLQKEKQCAWERFEFLVKKTHRLRTLVEERDKESILPQYAVSGLSRKAVDTSMFSLGV